MSGAGPGAEPVSGQLSTLGGVEEHDREHSEQAPVDAAARAAIRQRAPRRRPTKSTVTPHEIALKRLEELPALVQAQRNEAGLSLREAAAEIGIPFTTLSNAEHGQMSNAANLLAILEWLDRPPAWFLGPRDVAEAYQHRRRELASMREAATGQPELPAPGTAQEHEDTALIRGRVELALLRAGASLEQIAQAENTGDRIRFDPDAVAAALAGQRGFRLLQLALIADATGTSVGWLLGDPDLKPPRMIACRVDEEQEEQDPRHPTYTWGESVTCTAPDTMAVPLNLDGAYAADLILTGSEGAGVLAEMLTDAAVTQALAAVKEYGCILEELHRGPAVPGSLHLTLAGGSITLGIGPETSVIRLAEDPDAPPFEITNWGVILNPADLVRLEILTRDAKVADPESVGDPVHVQTSTFTVNAAHEVEGGESWAIEVVCIGPREYGRTRPENQRWIVTRQGLRLGRDGTWQLPPAARDEDWEGEHRFDLPEAVRLARQAADAVVVAGVSAAEARKHAWRQKHPDQPTHQEDTL